jgi:hypothetical protein
MVSDLVHALADRQRNDPAAWRQAQEVRARVEASLRGVASKRSPATATADQLSDELVAAGGAR